jgi:hypothetical protein
MRSKKMTPTARGTRGRSETQKETNNQIQGKKGETRKQRGRSEEKKGHSGAKAVPKAGFPGVWFGEVGQIDGPKR